MTKIDSALGALPCAPTRSRELKTNVRAGDLLGLALTAKCKPVWMYAVSSYAVEIIDGCNLQHPGTRGRWMRWESVRILRELRDDQLTLFREIFGDSPWYTELIRRAWGDMPAPVGLVSRITDRVLGTFER